MAAARTVPSSPLALYSSRSPSWGSGSRVARLPDLKTHLVCHKSPDTSHQQHARHMTLLAWPLARSTAHMHSSSSHSHTAPQQGHCPKPAQPLRATAEGRSHAPLLPDARLVRSLSARAHSRRCRQLLLHKQHRPHLLLAVAPVQHGTCAAPPMQVPGPSHTA